MFRELIIMTNNFKLTAISSRDLNKKELLNIERKQNSNR